MKKVLLLFLVFISSNMYASAVEPLCTFSDDSILKLRAGILRVLCVKDSSVKFYLNNQDININEYVRLINTAIQSNEINTHSQNRPEAPVDDSAKQSTGTGDCRNMSDTIKTLRFKQKSPEIKQAQDILYSEKYLANPPNGYFGAGTLSGIKKFQKTMKLQITGALDTATWKKLKDVCLASPVQ